MIDENEQQPDGWYVLLEATQPQPQIQLWLVAIANQAAAEAAAANAAGALANATSKSSMANPSVLAAYDLRDGDVRQFT